mgnify:CR=1 FL=1
MRCQTKEKCRKHGRVAACRTKKEGDAASRQQSELGRLFRRDIWGFAVAIEPLARSFGHTVAQHVAKRRAVGFALLALQVVSEIIKKIAVLHLGRTAAAQAQDPSCQ